VKLGDACQQVYSCCTHPDQQVRTFQADITDQASLTAVLQPALDRFGTPDLLINNAGMTHPGYFTDVDLDMHRQNMELNYFGTLYATHLLVPGMIARGSGHIVNISSLAGFHGIIGYSAYSPSKFAVRGLSDVLYYELKPLGIKVSVVFPADTNTPQLAEENKIKPALLKKMAEANNKVLQPPEVARKIVKDMLRGRYLITPGPDSILFYNLNSLPWKLPYWIMEGMIADARRKIAKYQASH
jgi:short-subunit dehydrogenase